MNPVREPETIRVGALGQRPIEVLYWVDAGKIFILIVDPNSRWLAMALKEGVVQITSSTGVTQNRSVALITDTVVIDRVQAGFAEKYGEGRWKRYFSRGAKVLSLAASSATTSRARETRIREEFDSIAGFYHDRVLANPFERFLKNQSRNELRALFSQRNPLLEIGSGTGIETLPLLEEGHAVTALDISGNMLEQLRRRAGLMGVGAELKTVEGTIGNLEGVLESVPNETFQGAYSTFGALNLEPDLENLPRTLARLLSPGAYFFAGVLNRLAILPLVYELAVSGPRGAVARLENPIPAGSIRYPLEVFPLNPYSFSRKFSPWFRLESIRAVSVLAPPYPSVRLFAFWGEIGRKKLARFDQRLAKSSGGVWLGEWAFVKLRRTVKASR